VRSDNNKGGAFCQSSQWRSNSPTGLVVQQKDGTRKLNSFSGNERNYLYMNHGGKSFSDFSQLSGLDHIGDGRSFAYFDYDRDGWQDIVLISVNAPRIQIFRNQLGEQRVKGGNHVTIRFSGGNTEATASADFSNRDGYGSKVTAVLADGTTLYREHQCGAGMAAQNSGLMHLGIGKAEKIDNLTVRWPSGIIQEHRDIPAGSLITVPEGGEVVRIN